MRTSGISKLIKILFFRLGLWVPIAYSLLFLLVMLVTKTPLSSVSALFWIGLIVSLVFGVSSAILFKIKKIERSGEKKERTRYIAPSQPGKEETGFSDRVARSNSVVREGAPAPTRLFPTNAEIEAEEERRYEEPDRTVDEFIRPKAERQYLSERNGFSDELLERESFVSRRQDEPIERTFDRREQEQPRIFRTRMDENMLIYEYSDRLEFYRSDGGILKRLSTEYKR